MFARSNDVDIFYTAHGQGIPLMVMHGGMGLDHSYFRPWLDPLADRFQLIYYDHRGNGKSTLLRDFEGIDHGTWADDAESLRKHLGHEKIFLLGHSCGGFVAMEYARRYGKRLAGLILCCSTPAMDYPDVIMTNARTRGTPDQLQAVITAFTQPLTGDEEMRGLYHKIFSLYFKTYDSKTGYQMINAIRYNHQAFNHCASSWFPAFSSLGWLAEIKVPTLILSGKEDWIMPPVQGGERLHAGIRGSRQVLFESSGHMPFVEEQQKFITLIHEWCAAPI